MTEKVKSEHLDILLWLWHGLSQAAVFYTTAGGNWDKDNYWVFVGTLFYSQMVLYTT